MEYRTSTVEQIREFSRYLREEERETATIDKYSRDVKDFFIWLKDREISRERMGEWRGYLLQILLVSGTERLPDQVSQNPAKIVSQHRETAEQTGVYPADGDCP